MNATVSTGTSQLPAAVESAFNGTSGTGVALAPVIPRPQATYGGPYQTDGGSGLGYGYYDAVQYSTNRAARPFFATDSKFTLTSWNRLRALSLARWAYINVPCVRGAVDLTARLTVGTGFTCVSHSGNPEWDKAADAITADAFRNIGFAGVKDMNDLLLHDSRASDVDGDLGYVMVEDDAGNARLQLIESHRIRNGDVSDPKCIDGVWTDDFGRVTDYNVLLPGDDKTRKIPAFNFIFLAERNRPDELRSMTNLIHALNPLQDLYEIMAFEMQSVKKNSETGMTVETDTPDSPPLGPPSITFGAAAMPAQGNQPAQGAQYYTREQVYGSGGKVLVLKPGEKVSAHDHTRPAPGLPIWVELVIRNICVGLGVPFEVVWNPESIGGANTRLITALLRARLEQRRNNLIFPKLRRARFWILSRAVKQGRLAPNPGMTNVEFQPNFTDITVDAGRESRERRQNVVQGLDTFTSYFAENGESYEKQLKVRAAEVDAQLAAAKELADKYKLPIGAVLDRIALLTANLSQMTSEADASGGGEPPKKNNPPTA